MVAIAAMAGVSVFGVVAVWLGLLGASQVRVSQAADLAALAGADKVLLDHAAACQAAAEIVARHRAQLVSCQVVGLDVQVQVSAPLAGVLAPMGHVGATARAGPPD